MSRNERRAARIIAAAALEARTIGAPTRNDRRIAPWLMKKVDVRGVVSPT